MRNSPMSDINKPSDENAGEMDDLW
ncbi:hypothetical protein VWV77_003816, partial [Cronobacter sakazakii]|nr:hypothetical protein [Cronobacter sakazakii]